MLEYTMLPTFLSILIWYHTIVYYTRLYSTMLYYTVLCYTMRYSIILTPYLIILQSTILSEFDGCTWVNPGRTGT